MTTKPSLSLHGLHHVTAITAEAQANLDFYTKTLGMRLVKRTVNQDDVRAYHLFYADERGSAGADLTFFEWPQMRPARRGAGAASETGLRVLGGEASLSAWQAWFASQGVKHGEVEIRTGLPTLPFEDHEGQRLRLVAESTPAETSAFYPWRGSPVPLSAAIVGLSEVTLTVTNAKETASMLETVLGLRPHGEESGLWETGPGGPGARLRLLEEAGYGTQGSGSVHHVAWRVSSPEEILQWQQQLERYGIHTSGKIDRHYFQSLYFRIPGHVLFEIATDGPGFTADGEGAEHLGERLALPPFLEPRRVEIEADVKPLRYYPPR